VSKGKSVIAIVTARMASSRLPGKPLADIAGMPMVLHCFFRSTLAARVDSVYVATCDDAIAQVAEAAGAPVLWTSTDHPSAMSRAAEAADILSRGGIEPEVVILVQGDEPLLDPAALDLLADALTSATECGVVNAVTPFASEQAFLDVNNVKVVASDRGEAVFLSRSPIPSPWRGWQAGHCLMQTGLIALRPESLRWFSDSTPSPVEHIESVDVLRFVLGGIRVKLLEIASGGVGVDTPEDLRAARQLMDSDVLLDRYLPKA